MATAAVELGHTPSMSKPVLETTTSISLSKQVIVTWFIVQVCNHFELLCLKLEMLEYLPSTVVTIVTRHPLLPGHVLFSRPKKSVRKGFKIRPGFFLVGYLCLSGSFTN